ncbi:MAG: hypothetical protein JXQ73_24050 [Phycisphaerae bacterium]|nr:hypothetical protein [Phycisphaerae bacterium]
MRRASQSVIGIALAALLVPLSGCAGGTEYLVFLRTEVARITANVLGQILLVLYQATS